MENDILSQLRQIAQERDLPLEDLLHELETTISMAYKKHAGIYGEVSVKLDPTKGWTANVEKEVVAVVDEPASQISLEAARRVNPKIEVGDTLPIAVDPNRFGRIAASSAKQVLSQKLKEAETRRVTTAFSDRMSDIVTGTVSRRERDNIYIQVNRVEAELPRKEQVPTEPYRINDRLKVYVVKVDETRRTKVIVSRTHPNLIRKLLEAEVPEIESGIVVIESVAREPGQRSKIAVRTTDERVDPIGACIGPRGARIQTLVEELYDEKIDVIQYSEDAKKYIMDALSPAKVSQISINEPEKQASVVVPDSQLSLAIGKGGQNVRLAARLTGYKIDIRAESGATGSDRRAERQAQG